MINTRHRRPLMTLPARHFSWAKMPNGSNRGTCDESDMPELYASRVWIDACDMGFLVAGRTETRLYVHDRMLRDEREQEVIAEVFACVDHPQDEIFVYND